MQLWRIIQTKTREERQFRDGPTIAKDPKTPEICRIDGHNMLLFYESLTMEKLAVSRVL